MKKTMALVVAIALIATIFVGCNKKNTTSSSTSETELEFYYYKQENQEGLVRITKAFVKDNPDIKIKMLIIPNDADASMSARAAQNELPDIIQMQSYARVEEYAEKGYLLDLTDDDVMKNVLPSALPAVTWHGKQYAVPMDFAGIGIIYNKKIFEQFGIEPPTTYRELENVCRVLKENDVVPFAGLLRENWSAGHFITMIHTALLAEKELDANAFIASMKEGSGSYGDVDTAKLFSILDFYRENMNSNAGEMGGREQQQSFAKGEAAMMVQGLWAYVDALKLNPGLDAGFIPFPVYGNADMNKFYADVDSTFGISAQSNPRKQAAAKRFLTWLSSEQGKALWVSEYKLTHSFEGGEFTTLGGPYEDLMVSVAEKGAYPWAFSQYPSVVFEDACKNGAQQYLLQVITADKVIENIDNQWNSLK